MIAALIVDDERLARSRVAKLLASHDDIRVVGECRNGGEAVEFINSRKPDLIFLDVQMPDLDGFDVLARADLKYHPFVIFATAYDKYALRAFDVRAIDYLLKPFDQERFDASVMRAKEQIRLQRTAELSAKLIDLIKEHGEKTDIEPAVIDVESRGRQIRIDPVDIEWIRADGNYVTICANGKTYLHRATLTSMEQILDPARFLRIHRQHLVGVAHTQRVRYLNRNNEYEFIMRSGETLVSGRSYKTRVREFLRHTRLLDD